MINKLNIITGYKAGQSYLKDTYFTRPFRIANVGEDKSDPSLYLMIMSSSPGILDNDSYDIDITIETNCRLQLQTQSYQRLFRMKDGAQQKISINLHANSELSYISHPIVPHENSIFKSHNVVHLNDNCVFTYSEIITCGRKYSGEVFRFKQFQNLTEIYYHNKLLIKDNILLEPNLMEINVIGQVEGYTHQATLLHVNTGEISLENQAIYIRELLAPEDDIIFGISQPLPYCIIIRILGNGGEQLYTIFRSIQTYLWQLKTIQQVSTVVN